MKRTTRSFALLVCLALPAAVAPAATLVIEREFDPTPTHSYWYEPSMYEGHVADSWTFDTTPVTFAMADYDEIELRLVAPPGKETYVNYSCHVYMEVHLGTWGNYSTRNTSVALLGPDGSVPTTWYYGSGKVDIYSGDRVAWLSHSADSPAAGWAFQGITTTINVSDINTGTKTYGFLTSKFDLAKNLNGPEPDPGPFSYLRHSGQPGTVNLQPQPGLGDLLNTPQPLGTDKTVTDLSAGNLHAEIWSRGYTDGQGKYVYCYQVHNTGSAGNAPVELFGLWPFPGADSDTQMGYFTGTLPGDFSGAPWTEARGQAYVELLSSGPQISFYHSLVDGFAVDAGEHGPLMYVVSDLPPDRIDGSLAAAGVQASGKVVGPVPEPATLGIFALCGFALLRRRPKSR